LQDYGGERLNYEGKHTGSEREKRVEGQEVQGGKNIVTLPHFLITEQVSKLFNGRRRLGKLKEKGEK